MGGKDQADREELIRLCDALQHSAAKAAESEAEEERALDALKLLGEIPITTDLLMETQVSERGRIG